MVPDSKVRGTNMGPIWGRQDPGGPHVGPMNIAIWGGIGVFVIIPTPHSQGHQVLLKKKPRK